MQKKIIFSLVLILVLGVVMYRKTRISYADSTTKDAGIYPYNLTSLDGKPLVLSDFKGKIVLIVNVASKCGFTSQYQELEALYDAYKDKGVVVLGVPANNFRQQEPGNNEEIKQFCSLTYNVTFPMSQKISVKGNDIHPLYKYLTQETSNKKVRGDISWNFNKFLIDQNGKVVDRYSSFTTPMSPKIIKKIEALLKK